MNQAASPGTTLKIGTTPGGSEIASDIPIDTTTLYPPFEFKRVELAADGFLYATPSTNIPDYSLLIYLSAVPNYITSCGMYLRTAGYPVITESTFLSNGSSDALNIGSDIISTQNWKFSNCHFETLDPQNQSAVSAEKPVSDAAFYNCTFIGRFRNVTVRQ